MKTGKWVPVVLPFGVALLGSNAYRWVETSSESWGPILASLYYIPVVIAAISLGSRLSVLVALAAGAALGAGRALGPDGSWLQPLAQTVLFVCVGLTAAKLAEWLRSGAVESEDSKAPQADAVETDSEAVQDTTQMPALSRMAIGLVRQFRTPVTSIEGAGWVLEDPRLPDDKRQEFVGIVRKESHRLSRVLSDVSEFARPRKPRLHSVDLSPLMDEIFRLANPKDDGPPFVFQKDISPDFPPLRCDREQISRMLLNLTMNAVEASPAGGQIEISAAVEDGAAVIRVKDHGTGIPKSIADRIFEPFFSTRDTGLGLGLPVVLNIVTEHGGKIAVEQVPDYSTCIAVSLPLSRQ